MKTLQYLLNESLEYGNLNEAFNSKVLQNLFSKGDDKTKAFIKGHIDYGIKLGSAIEDKDIIEVKFKEDEDIFQTLRKVSVGAWRSVGLDLWVVQGNNIVARMRIDTHDMKVKTMENHTKIRQYKELLALKDAKFYAISPVKFEIDKAENKAEVEHGVSSKEYRTGATKSWHARREKGQKLGQFEDKLKAKGLIDDYKKHKDVIDAAKPELEKLTQKAAIYDIIGAGHGRVGKGVDQIYSDFDKLAKALGFELEFYGTGDRYIGLKDKNTVKGKPWTYKDNDGNWTTFKCHRVSYGWGSDCTVRAVDIIKEMLRWKGIKSLDHIYDEIKSKY